MSLVTITEAAQLVGKSTHTLYRDIKKGKLSRDANGKFDTSELIRVYGELKPTATSCHSNATANNSNTQQNDMTVIALLQQQIARLETDMKALKTESLEREHQAIERERRLLA